MNLKQKKFLLQLIDQLLVVATRERQHFSVRRLLEENKIVEEDLRSIAVHVWKELGNK